MTFSLMLVRSLAAVLVLMTTLGCSIVKVPAASSEEKRSFLFASAAEQAATGPKNCRAYAEGLSARLVGSPYRYDVEPLYYCSMGAECHVLLKVNTGDAQFVADNGAFIVSHVEPLGEFEYRASRHVSWQRMQASEANVLMMAERYGHVR